MSMVQEPITSLEDGVAATDRALQLQDVLACAVTPLMLKTDENPEGLPLEAFDGIRKSTALDRSQFFRNLALPFYGFNREGATINESLPESLWLMGGIKREYDCIREFSEIDYTQDLRRIDKPTDARWP